MSPAPLSPRAFVTGVLCAAAVLVIWTSFILVARGSANAGTLLPLDIAFLRFAASAAVALPVVAWLAWRRRLAPLPWRRTAVLAAVAGAGYCGLAYSGFFFAPAAHAAVLLPGSLPLWTAAAAALLLGQWPAPARWAGLGLIVAGNALVGGASLLQALQPGGAGTVWIGDLLFLSASACWALYSVLCRRWQVGAVPATLGIAVGCGLACVPPYALAVAAGWVPSGLAAAPWREIVFQAVYQGVFAMLLAGLAFTQVVATFGPQRTTMITAAVPVLAALAAVPLLGEALSAAALAGLVCVTAGLLLGLRSGSRPRPGTALEAAPR